MESRNVAEIWKVPMLVTEHGKVVEFSRGNPVVALEFFKGFGVGLVSDEPIDQLPVITFLVCESSAFAATPVAAAVDKAVGYLTMPIVAMSARFLWSTHGNLSELWVKDARHIIYGKESAL